MNPRNDNQRDDAEFEAFLRGEGELVRALREVLQPVVPDALSEAILAQAEASLRRSAAANDASVASPAAPPPQHFLRRARVPLAMAASVLLALSLGLQWKERQEPARETAAVAVAPQPATPPAASASPAPAAVTPPPPTRLAEAARPPQSDTSNKPAPVAPAEPPITIAQADIDTITSWINAGAKQQ